MAHPHTKWWISTSVAAGFKRPMMNQIPTPVSAPKTSVIKTKNFVSDSRYSSFRVSPAFLADVSATTRYNPPPMAKWDTKTWGTAIAAISTP